LLQSQIPVELQRISRIENAAVFNLFCAQRPLRENKLFYQPLHHITELFYTIA